VALSGGCFQNERLLRLTVGHLREAGLQPVWHQRIPPNDGGIALGQIAAAWRR
jgi:hydrogenase maturation protein HypF